jgi:hypothetical protein
MNREHIDAILAQHAKARQLLRDARTAFDSAIAGSRVALDAVAAANHAQGQAMDVVIAANRAALRLVQEGRKRRTE